MSYEGLQGRTSLADVGETRGCRKNCVPGLTHESAEMYKRYTHHYESYLFAEGTIDAGEELMSTISEERRRAWQTLIDMTHSKAWATI